LTQFARGPNETRIWGLAALGGVAYATAMFMGKSSEAHIDQAIRLHNEAIANPQDISYEQLLTSRKPRVDGFGFDFDKPQQDAAISCLQASLLGGMREGAYICSGLPSNEIPYASAELSFADQRILKMRIVVRPPENAEKWTGAFRKTLSTLTRVYGKPKQRDIVIPNECKATEQFLDCLATGDVTASATWTRSDNRFVSMKIANSMIVVDISRGERPLP
jgi:hypothetical protein